MRWLWWVLPQAHKQPATWLQFHLPLPSDKTNLNLPSFQNGQISIGGFFMDMHPSYCGLHFESNLVHGLAHVRIYLQLEFFVFKNVLKRVSCLLIIHQTCIIVFENHSKVSFYNIGRKLFLCRIINTILLIEEGRTLEGHLLRFNPLLRSWFPSS